MEKYAENMHQRLIPDAFFIFLYNLQQPLHARSFYKGNIP